MSIPTTAVGACQATNINCGIPGLPPGFRCQAQGRGPDGVAGSVANRYCWRAWPTDHGQPPASRTQVSACWSFVYSTCPGSLPEDRTAGVWKTMCVMALRMPALEPTCNECPGHQARLVGARGRHVVPRAAATMFTSVGSWFPARRGPGRSPSALTWSFARRVIVRWPCSAQQRDDSSWLGTRRNGCQSSDRSLFGGRTARRFSSSSMSDREALFRCDHVGVRREWR